MALIIVAKRLNNREMSAHARFYPRPSGAAENPRVGGSIPPLATTKHVVYTDDIGNLASMGRRNTGFENICWSLPVQCLP